MATLLNITVSPRGDYSVSRTLGRHYVAEWEAKHPGGRVIDRDLAKEPLPFVDLPWIAGAYSTPDQHTPEQKAAIKVSDDLIKEIFEADQILIATPMYNFAIPAALKSWVDHIVRFDVTFNAQYQGLVPAGKKVQIILASGGEYKPGSHMESANAASTYLKQILGFIGLTHVDTIFAGNTAGIDRGQTTLPDLIKPIEPEVAAAAAR